MHRELTALLAGCFLCPLLALAQAPERVSVQREPAADYSLYGKLEYIIWFLREGRIPPILTTGSAATGGTLGAPDTRVLYGEDRLETRHDNRFIGARPTLGCWLDDEHTLAVEGSAFFLERDSTYFKTVSDGSTVLARPFFAPDGTPRSEIVAGPLPGGGVRNGGFNGYSRIELFGEELNLVLPLGDGDPCHVELLLGSRFLQMRDRVDFTATGRLLPDQATLFGLTDHFRAANQFYGGQAGVRGEYLLGNWFANLRGEAAVGGTHQIVRAFGDRTFRTPTVREVQPFGLLVQSSNTGRFTRTTLDGVFEVGANLGFQPTEHLRVFGGYTFLCWLNPVRAGDQVDLVVNTTQATGPLVGPKRPAIPFQEDFFWAQGVNVGLEVRW